jgi:hypothetical protein
VWIYCPKDLFTTRHVFDWRGNFGFYFFLYVETGKTKINLFHLVILKNTRLNTLESFNVDCFATKLSCLLLFKIIFFLERKKESREITDHFARKNEQPSSFADICNLHGTLAYCTPSTFYPFKLVETLSFFSWHLLFKTVLIRFAIAITLKVLKHKNAFFSNKELSEGESHKANYVFLLKLSTILGW